MNRFIQKRVAAPQHVYCRPDRDGMLIPNRADGCRSFFKCSGGKPVLTQCGADLLFNEKTNYCDWEYNVQCGPQSVGSGQRPSSKYQLPVSINNRQLRTPGFFKSEFYHFRAVMALMTEPLMPITKLNVNRITSVIKASAGKSIVPTIYFLTLN